MASENDAIEAPWVGAVLAGGLPAVIRIPLPGPGNLAISLRPPQGWKGKSTCTVFIMQDKWKGLRLDYGFNVKTNTVDFAGPLARCRHLAAQPAVPPERAADEADSATTKGTPLRRWPGLAKTSNWAKAYRAENSSDRSP